MLPLLFLLLVFDAGSGQVADLLQSGLRALQHGNLQTARTDLEQASRLDPKNAFVWSSLAEVYGRSHEAGRASAAAETAEQNANGNPVIAHALAMYYSESGEFKRAAKLEAEFAGSPKADKNAANRAAEFYLKANDAEAALPLAEKAAQGDPQIAFQWAQAFLSRQDFTPAAGLLENALHNYPADAQLNLALGVARYGQRRFEDAIKAFLKVIQLDPQIQQPYDFLGRMLDQAGVHLPEITRIYSERAAQQPDDAKAQFLLAKALLTGDSKDPKAEPLLRKSIALNADRWESHYELGVLLAGRHEYKESAAELIRSIELDAKQPTPHYQLARVYDRLGQPERAKEEREIHRKLTAPSGGGMQ